MDAGSYAPDMVLHRNLQRLSDARSGWVVQKTNRSYIRRLDTPKVLVNDILHQDDIITFMSNYRTKDYIYKGRRRRKGKKYAPKGCLCWYPCDAYGTQTGPAIFIKRIPDAGRSTDDGYTQLKIYRQHVVTLTEIFSQDPRGAEMPYTSAKPKLYQYHVAKQEADTPANVQMDYNPHSVQDQRRSNLRKRQSRENKERTKNHV